MANGIELSRQEETTVLKMQSLTQVCDQHGMSRKTIEDCGEGQTKWSSIETCLQENITFDDDDDYDNDMQNITRIPKTV